MSEEQKNYLKDMLKSEGWKIYEELSLRAIEEYRRLATQPDVELEKRLWYSAMALGREEALQEPVEKVIVDRSKK